ncbi:general transcriptional corepressor trfA-like [Centruroides vittatus]|uniref:general transcriptional corepressor trfA-like n=1 Tax=Centruroides vittatus TaxID=120091 RepID=UPI00350F6FB4
MAILYEITSEKKSILCLYRRNKSNFSSSYKENNQKYSILNENMTSLRPALSVVLRLRRDIHSKVNRNKEKEQTAVKNGEMASKLEDRNSEESKKNGKENNDKSKVSSSDKNKLDSIYAYLKSLLNVKEANDKENLKFGPRSIPYFTKERRHLRTKTSQNRAKTITERQRTTLRKANHKNLKKHIRIASKNSKQRRENEAGHNSLIERVKTATPVKFILLFMVLCVSIVIITVLFNCPLIYKALTGGSYDRDGNAKRPLISVSEENPRKRRLPSKNRHRNVKEFRWNVKKSTKSESDSSENESNTSERSRITETKLFNGVKKMPNSNEKNIQIDKQSIKVRNRDRWEIVERATDQKREFGEDIETKFAELKKGGNVVELCASLSPKTNKNTENIARIEQENVLREKNIKVILKSKTEHESESSKCGQYLSELRNVLDVANEQLGKDESNCETNLSNNCNVWKCEPRLLEYNFSDNTQTKDETTTTDEERVTTSANIIKQGGWRKKLITNSKREITKLSQIRKILRNSVNSDETIRNTTNVSKHYPNPQSTIDILEEFQTDDSFSDSFVIDHEYKDGVLNDTNDNSETETSSSPVL